MEYQQWEKLKQREQVGANKRLNIKFPIGRSDITVSGLKIQSSKTGVKIGDVVIEVWHAEIRSGELCVEAITSAADTLLSNSGGAAKVIADKAGRD